MSFIVHRCECGHTDIAHDNGGNRCQHRCPCTRLRKGDIELLPTKNNGVPVETVAKPGTKPPGYTGATLCGCNGYQGLYRELTGAASGGQHG
jgi:hypothetical protein